MANTSDCFKLAPYQPLQIFSMLSDFNLVSKTDFKKFYGEQEK